ncbi:hypothetical protein [Microbacterium ulmi]|uniref:LPXTG-motif cell wall anchor domain-containing protein n=1 Tax=Microbacterium ulmi TaxID=179095 RepID=A0A7Y2M3A6_9MICO|nr:hypothetical protein [Microbacterium ulmi]NII70167.1 hypothetical protein [Microbacterium ulmi]NNH04293.1 hypothetical protein [Microbacterium ulmi]
MFKKAITALAIAGAIILSGAAAATAADYPPEEDVVVSSPTVAPGGSITITITGLEELEGLTVTFTITAGPSGGSLSSIFYAATADDSVDKVVSGGSASATFTSTTPGAYTVTIFGPDGEVLGTAGVTVAASSTGGGGLPATGGTVPAAAIWLGAGAIGIGGIAVTAVAARRRARNH